MRTSSAGLVGALLILFHSAFPTSDSRSRRSRRLAFSSFVVKRMVCFSHHDGPRAEGRSDDLERSPDELRTLLPNFV